MAVRIALCAAVAVLMLLPSAAAAGPSQVHLSQPAEGIVVQWALLGDARSLPVGRVEWGPTALYGNVAQGEMVGYVDATPYIGYSQTSITRDLAEAAATLYRAQLPAIPPGTTFHYRVVDGTGLPTGDFTARTLPGPSSSLRFVAYADQGSLEDGTLGPPGVKPMEIINLSVSLQPQLAVIAGDLSYSEEGGLRFWNQWFDILQPLASTTPTFAAVGNHDRDLLVGYDQWNKRLSQPREEQNYGFDAGPVHFIVLNSQEMCLEGETTENVQRVNPNCTVTTASGAPVANEAIIDFMHEDLADARARGVPWIVAVFHHPPYAHAGYNETLSGASYMWWMRDHWLPILEQYGVDLVLNGHDHSYARSWPMLDNATTRTSGTKFTEGNGIVYVVTGGGGRELYTLSPGEPWWLAKRAQTHHVTLVDATASKMKVSVRDHNGATIDAFELRKAGGGAQNALPVWIAAVALAGVLGHHLARRRLR